MVRVIPFGTSTLDIGLPGATVIADTDFFDVFYPGDEAVLVTKLTAAAFFGISSTPDTFHMTTDDFGGICIGYKVGTTTTWLGRSPSSTGAPENDVTDKLRLCAYKDIGLVLTVGDTGVSFTGLGMFQSTSGSTPSKWRRYSTNRENGHLCIFSASPTRFSWVKVCKDTLSAGGDHNGNVHTMFADQLQNVTLTRDTTPTAALRQLLLGTTLKTAILDKAKELKADITTTTIEENLGSSGAWRELFLTDAQVSVAANYLQTERVLCTNKDMLVLPIDVTDGTTTKSLKVVFVSPSL
jgi:hypothetical protein